MANDLINSLAYVMKLSGFPGGISSKDPTCQCRRHETWVWSLGLKDPLEEGMATHPSILVWRTPWTEEPDWLPSIKSQRAGYDWSDLAHTMRLPQGPLNKTVRDLGVGEHIEILGGRHACKGHGDAPSFLYTLPYASLPSGCSWIELNCPLS